MRMLDLICEQWGLHGVRDHKGHHTPKLAEGYANLASPKTRSVDFCHKIKRKSVKSYWSLMTFMKLEYQGFV